jgi:hypothetical protein
MILCVFPYSTVQSTVYATEGGFLFIMDPMHRKFPLIANPLLSELTKISGLATRLVWLAD